MKGIVFTEFLEMVENKFGLVLADQIIVESKASSGGAYTSVGTYDHAELVAMVMCLSKATGVPVAALVESFGEYLFGRFAILYPAFFVGVTSVFDFLSRIEQYIHPEVRKLYPDAELPTFDTRRIGPDGIELIYRSSRQFGDLAEGLMRGCAKHFGEPISIGRSNISDESGSAIRFIVTRTLANAA